MKRIGIIVLVMLAILCGCAKKVSSDVEKESTTGEQEVDYNSATFVANVDYGMHVVGAATILLDGYKVFFELEDAVTTDGTKLETLVAGDKVTVKYTGEMLMLESYPGSVVIHGDVLEIIVEKAEIAEITVEELEQVQHIINSDGTFTPVNEVVDKNSKCYITMDDFESNGVYTAYSYNPRPESTAIGENSKGNEENTEAADDGIIEGYKSWILYANYSRAGLGGITGVGDSLYRIQSESEVDSFIDANTNDYSMFQFQEASKEWDEQFFENNEIFLTYISASSGSYVINVESVTVKDNCMSIDISEKMPEVGTMDMAGWFVVVAVKKSDIKGCTSYKIEKSNPLYQMPMKGIEVYVWKMNDSTYRCGHMIGTNRMKTVEEIIELESMSIEEMQEYLKQFDEPDMISVCLIQHPISSYMWNADEEDMAYIRECFNVEHVVFWDIAGYYKNVVVE